MREVDGYLHRVARRMVGLDAAVRADALRELRAHLHDAAAEAGGNWSAVLEGAEPPAAVARRYREVYGFGRPFQGVLFLGAFLLGLGTVPMFPLGDHFGVAYGVATAAFAALVLYLLWVSVAAGNVAGLLASLAAVSSRLLVAGLAILAGTAGFLEGGVALFLLVTGGLVPLGYLPGTAKRRWQGPRADL